MLDNYKDELGSALLRYRLRQGPANVFTEHSALLVRYRQAHFQSRAVQVPGLVPLASKARLPNLGFTADVSHSFQNAREQVKMRQR